MTSGDCSTLEIPQVLAQALGGGDVFASVMRLQGKKYREVTNRRTIQVNLGGGSYFVKQHFGVGWREIFKNLLIFKKPILGAMTEVAAIRKLGEIGIPTTPLVAYGQRGCNPATRQSFVLTEDLGEIITAEDLCESWQTKSEDFKQTLIQALAALASKLHGAGLCHRDFYLCHFVVKKAEWESGRLNLILIDLHRVLQGQPPHGKAVMKDIAGLFFSAMQAGWSSADLALFKQHYLPQSPAFWAQVEERSQVLLAKFNSEKFQARLAADREKLK